MSTGLYVHINRAPGTILSAELYNTAHRNHLTNDIPTSAGGHSDDVTMMQATTDPYPGAVATPVASMADEIQQLRFVIQDIKSFIAGAPVAQWYSDITTPTQDDLNAYAAQASVGGSAQSIPDATSTPIIFDQTDYDTGVNGTPFWSGGNPTRLTAPVSGLYDVSASLQWFTSSGPPTTGTFILQIVANGTTKLVQMNQGGDGQTATTRYQSVDTTIQLTAGDYIEAIVFQSEAGGSIWDARFPIMSMVLLASYQPLQATGITVHFKLSQAPTGFIEIDDGTGVNSYPVTNGVDDFTTLQTSIVSEGTVVTMRALDSMSAPWCVNGAGFTSSWTGEVITNCGSGYPYQDDVTIVAAESANGDISFTAFP